jgi:cyanophycin synthetase
VNTEAELEAAAAEIGWPLVVKPLDQSCQQGVTTDVADQISLQAAFLVARNVSKSSVLVQEQVLGQEFRLTAIGTNHVFARAMNFAFVEGDGASTVAQLVMRSNANPLIGGHPGAIAHGIELDSVAMAELASQELSAQSIPMAGQKVRLSRKPFRSVGGITTDASATLHPSYFDLLQRAARVLQLDVIGIDLITADPGKPWWEVGAKILECNPRPGIIQHEFPLQNMGIHRRAFKHWLGEIAMPPLIAVAAGAESSDICAAVEASLSVLLAQHQAVGVLCEGICRVGAVDYPLAASAGSQTGQSLLAEPACGAAVLAWRSDDLLAYGRPCERIDVGVLAEGAEPLVVQEILDANPSAVVWLGQGMQEWSEQINAWQARSPGRRLVELQQSRELIDQLPTLLGASTH